MRICDVCKAVVLHLEHGPENCESMDVCEPCRRDLHQRLQDMEKHMAEYRQKQRLEAITAWKRERSPRGEDPALKADGK